VPLNFPTSPSLNDTYSFGGKTWIWNGEYWRLQSAGAINDIPIGNVTANTGNFTTLSVQTGVSSDLIPTANITYDLGSNNYRWNDIWLANSTIHIGNGSISANSTSLVLINPNGTQFSGGGGGGGSPGGSDTQVQFNDGGSFGGTVGFTFDKTSNLVTVSGNISGANVIQGGTRVFKYFVSNTTPAFAEPGDAWYYPVGDTLYNYINDGVSSQWVENLGVSLPAASTAATANTLAQRDTNASITANVFIGLATSAQYADLAENYQSDQAYAPGTVVVIGGSKEITQSTCAYDTKALGVISTAPAYRMNMAMEGSPVALTGRVPCFVTGPINKGDLLVSSDIPGHAQAMEPDRYRPGCVIGKSLQDFVGGNGMIEIMVGRF